MQDSLDFFIFDDITTPCFGIELFDPLPSLLVLPDSAVASSSRRAVDRVCRPTRRSSQKRPRSRLVLPQKLQPAPLTNCSTLPRHHRTFGKL
jgi:hypothetical protein